MLFLCSSSAQSPSVTTWKMCTQKVKVLMKCVTMYWIASCHFMCQALSLKLWKNSKLAGSLMIWFMELSLECFSVTLCRVLCLTLLQDWEKRTKASMTTRRTSVMSVICPDKWCRRREKLFQIIQETSISYGIMCFILSHLRERTVMTTLVWSMKYHRSTICQTRKWMFHGFHQKESHNSASLMKRLSWLRLSKRTTLYYSKIWRASTIR